jgi:hypothetical protein
MGKACTSAPGSIPKVVHFVYGFNGPEEFHLYMYLAVQSFIFWNPQWRVFFYFSHKPYGKYWIAMENDARITLIQIPMFDYFGNARLHHYAHRADIVRLKALEAIGGFYLDIDTLTIKSFGDLIPNEFVMGIQADAPEAKGGLCNAVMGARAGAKFLRRWLRYYPSFRSKGKDAEWDYHSVRLPAKLAAVYYRELRVLPYDAFFFPLWHDLERVLFNAGSAHLAALMKDTYSFHLWNALLSSRLVQVDEEFLENSTCAYAQFARPILEHVRQ